MFGFTDDQSSLFVWRKNFKNKFFNNYFYNLDNFINNWYKGISLISTRSPLLLSKEHLRTELHFNTAIKNDQVSQVN